MFSVGVMIPMIRVNVGTTSKGVIQCITEAEGRVMRQWIDDDDDEMKLRARRERRRNSQSCRCGNDMPGYCPGPANCPMCEEDEEDES